MYTYLVIYVWIYPIFSPKITKFRTPAENNGLLSTGVTIYLRRPYNFIDQSHTQHPKQRKTLYWAAQKDYKTYWLVYLEPRKNVLFTFFSHGHSSAALTCRSILKGEVHPKIIFWYLFWYRFNFTKIIILLLLRNNLLRNYLERLDVNNTVFKNRAE